MDGAGRRSIYTASRRNFLPTLMLTFDTPTPFSTVGRRTVTNVPAQSLALLNDPLVYQQAGVWADRILREMTDDTAATRVQRMYLEAFGRNPDAAEQSAAVAALSEFAALYGCAEHDPRVWRDLAHAFFSSHHSPSDKALLNRGVKSETITVRVTRAASLGE